MRNQLIWSLHRNTSNQTFTISTIFTDSRRYTYQTPPYLQNWFSLWCSQSKALISRTRTWWNRCFISCCQNAESDKILEDKIDSFKFWNTVSSVTADAIFFVKTSSEKLYFEANNLVERKLVSFLCAKMQTVWMSQTCYKFVLSATTSTTISATTGSTSVVRVSIKK